MCLIFAMPLVYVTLQQNSCCLTFHGESGRRLFWVVVGTKSYRYESVSSFNQGHINSCFFGNGCGFNDGGFENCKIQTLYILKFVLDTRHFLITSLCGLRKFYLKRQWDFNHLKMKHLSNSLVSRLISLECGRFNMSYLC